MPFGGSTAQTDTQIDRDALEVLGIGGHGVLGSEADGDSPFLGAADGEAAADTAASLRALSRCSLSILFLLIRSSISACFLSTLPKSSKIPVIISILGNAWSITIHIEERSLINVCFKTAIRTLVPIDIGTYRTENKRSRDIGVVFDEFPKSSHVEDGQQRRE